MNALLRCASSRARYREFSVGYFLIRHSFCLITLILRGFANLSTYTLPALLSALGLTPKLFAKISCTGDNLNAFMG